MRRSSSEILMNLALNSRDAMPAGGKLTLELDAASFEEEYVGERSSVPAGDYAVLSVSDTGIGMTPEVRDRVFEPFFTTKGVGQGTGLGLAVCHGIVKQLGGHVWVYSEPGHGTTFKIYVPRVRSDAAIVPKASDDAELGGTETVLLVEDEPSVRAAVVRMLATRGYLVLVAPDADEALRVARAHSGPLHLLLTDLVLPTMTGRELGEILSRERSELRVVYMSGYTDDAIVRHGMLDAGVAFLQKPFSSRALLRKLRDALDMPN